MNPETMLTDLAKAVKERPYSASKKYCLYHDATGFHCEPVISHPPGALPLGVFDISRLKQGFSNKQWSGLLSKCARILKAEG